jgi:hypothetical protein
MGQKKPAPKKAPVKPKPTETVRIFYVGPDQPNPNIMSIHLPALLPAVLYLSPPPPAAPSSRRRGVNPPSPSARPVRTCAARVLEDLEGRRLFLLFRSRPSPHRRQRTLIPLLSARDKSQRRRSPEVLPSSRSGNDEDVITHLVVMVCVIIIYSIYQLCF